MIERGHKPIVDALAKMSGGGKRSWVANLHAVLFADRVTTKTTTGCTPYYLNHGSEAVLPIELEYPTWRISDFQGVQSTSDLLAVRARQFQRREEDLEEATHRLRSTRIANGEDFDARRRIRVEPLEVGELVLMHNAKRETDMSTAKKLDYRWSGPYRITLLNEKGTYHLAELDGTACKGTFAGNRLKKFVARIRAEDSEDDTERPETREASLAESSADEDASSPEESEDERAPQTRRTATNHQARRYIPAGERFAVVIGQTRVQSGFSGQK